MMQTKEICHVGRCPRGCQEVCQRAVDMLNAPKTTAQQVWDQIQLRMLGRTGTTVTTEEMRTLRAERRELQTRLSENAEIIAIHDKLQAGRLGMHPLVAAMCQVAAGASMDEAMRDIGYVAARQVPLSEQAARELADRWYEADESGIDLVRMTEEAHGICAASPSPTATDVSETSPPLTTLTQGGAL